MLHNCGIHYNRLINHKGEMMMKLIAKLLVVIILLMGCTNNPPQDEKANVHLYSYDGASVKAVVSKENYNKVIRLEITQIETGDVDDVEVFESLEKNRQSIEDFVVTIEDLQLVLDVRDPDNWVTNNFFNVRLAEEVATTDNNLYVFVVKYVINFDHETVEKQCCGYNDVVDYFGLENSIQGGQLTLDLLIENEEFVFHEVLVAENGLYVPQLEE